MSGIIQDRSATEDSAARKPGVSPPPLPRLLIAGAAVQLLAALGLFLLGLSQWYPPGGVADLLAILLNVLFLLSALLISVRREWAWRVALSLQVPLLGSMVWVSLKCLDYARRLRGATLLALEPAANWVALGLAVILGAASLVLLFVLMRPRVREAFGVRPNAGRRFTRHTAALIAVVVAAGAVAGHPLRRYVLGLMLWDAIWAHDVGAVTRLLRAGADPEQPYPRYGDTPLTRAISSGQIPIFDTLLDGGADPNGRGNWSGAPLFAATPMDNGVFLTGLLKHGADPSRVYHGGQPALIQATEAGYPANFLRLLEAGADPNQTGNWGDTVLMNVLRYGRGSSRLALLRSGRLKVGEHPVDGELFRAVLAGDGAATRRLLARGANPNAADGGGLTAMMGAADLGHADVLRELAAAHADVNATDAWGRTALHWAAAGNQPQAIRLLLDHGARLNAQDREREQTPLLLAVEQRRFEAAQLLIRRGADLRLEGKGHRTARSAADASGSRVLQNLLRSAVKRSRQPGTDAANSGKK